MQLRHCAGWKYRVATRAPGVPLDGPRAALELAAGAIYRALELSGASIQPLAGAQMRQPA
jgi:hypothetical protein